MIVQYPEHVSPGQRFRVELYKELLDKNGYEVTTAPFFDETGYRIIHRYGFVTRKVFALLKAFLQRIVLLFSLGKYDFIFIQREVTPVGPPVFEWIYSKVLKKKIIYDFDDAIWIKSVSDQNSLAAYLKCAWKVKFICKWAYKVSCGNEYLCNYARQFNKQVIYNPTCVDTTKRHNRMADHDAGKLTIGWTGSFSTLKYLDMVQPALSMLQEKYDFAVKIICNKKPSLSLKNMVYVEWTEDNEITELASCHIGLMPLTADAWSEGKCGFKLIQYLALGMPAVSSPVGVNKIIIEQGINGFFAVSDAEWFNAIEQLIINPELRKQMGKAGREKVVAQYSVQSNEKNYLSLFS